MEPLPPPPGAEGTSWFRYMDKYGPHVHNIAFYVHNAPALAARLAEAGVRTTDGGAPGAVFAHPKDTPAMLEFFDPGDPAKANLNDPRFSPYWVALRDDFWPRRHPLGVERLSHITVVVRDVAAARDVLRRRARRGCRCPTRSRRWPMPTPASCSSARTRCWSSCTRAIRRRSWHGELETVGQCVTAVTFKVRDIERAAGHLTLHSAPVLTVGEHRSCSIATERGTPTTASPTSTSSATRGRSPSNRRRSTTTCDVERRQFGWVRPRLRSAGRDAGARRARGTSGAATGRGKRGLPVIVENLRRIDADVLALTEVWEDDTRSQARELADARRLQRTGVRPEPPA